MKFDYSKSLYIIDNLKNMESKSKDELLSRAVQDFLESNQIKMMEGCHNVPKKSFKEKLKVSIYGGSDKKK
jgi:hypothetical protein